MSPQPWTIRTRTTSREKGEETACVGLSPSTARFQARLVTRLTGSGGTKPRPGTSGIPNSFLPRQYHGRTGHTREDLGVVRPIPRPARGGQLFPRPSLLFLTGLPAAALPLSATSPPCAGRLTFFRTLSDLLAPSSPEAIYLTSSAFSASSKPMFFNLLQQKSFLAGDVAPPSALPSPDWLSPPCSPTQCSLWALRGLKTVLVQSPGPACGVSVKVAVSPGCRRLLLSRLDCCTYYI